MWSKNRTKIVAYYFAEWVKLVMEGENKFSLKQLQEDLQWALKHSA
jgi:hypothetical protein